MIDWDKEKENARLFGRNLFIEAENTDLLPESKLSAFITMVCLYSCEVGLTLDEFKKKIEDLWTLDAKRLGERLRTLHKFKNDLKTESVATNGMD